MIETEDFSFGRLTTKLNGYLGGASMTFDDIETEIQNLDDNIYKYDFKANLLWTLKNL